MCMRRGLWILLCHKNPVPSPPSTKITWGRWVALIFAFLRNIHGNYFMLNAFSSHKMQAAYKHGITHNRLIKFLYSFHVFPPLKLNFETDQIGLSSNVSDLYSRGVRVRISAGTPNWVWSCHGSNYEDRRFLGCNAEWFGENSLPFAWLTLESWKWKLYVPAKHSASTELYPDTTKKTVPLAPTEVFRLP